MSVFSIKTIDYFSFKGIKALAEKAEMKYSIRNYTIVFLLLEAIVILVCHLYRMNISGILAALLFTAISIPYTVKIRFNQIIMKRRFQEVDLYLHQMSYSFQREPKINLALFDTQQVANENLKNNIEEAIKELRYGHSETIYNDALGKINVDYKCSRIDELHRFLVAIETKGGNYKKSLQVMTDDFNNWTEQIYSFQKDIKRLKLSSEIGVVLCIVMSLSTTLILSVLNSYAEMKVDVYGQFIYQLSCTVFIIMCIVYFIFLQKLFNLDWLHRQASQKAIIKDYNNYKKYKNKKNTLKNRLPAIILTSSIIITSFVLYILNQKLICFILMVLLFTGVFTLVNNKKATIRRTSENIFLCFTEWLRNVAVSIQSVPLMVAIEETYDNCPYVLKESLQRFICALEKNPKDVTVYYDFLAEYQNPDIEMAVRTLYSVSMQDCEFADNTVNSLVRSNYEMIQKHERTMNKDKLSLLRFCEYIPTVFVAIKISIDMLLIITQCL